MGQISTNFKEEEDQPSKLPQNITPAKIDWITAHAEASGLSIVEVERLWKRFQQLGCNSKGEIVLRDLQKLEIGSDVFAKNILTSLKSKGDIIRFLTFLNCMKWAEMVSQEEKIVAIFNLLNAGETINRLLLTRIVKRIYPGEDKNRYDYLTDVLLEQLGTDREGVVTPEQFVEHVKLLPIDSLDEMFSFLIVPKDINEEAHKVLSRQASHASNTSVKPKANNETPYPDVSNQIPTDNLLRRIAAKVCKHDWHLLANQLGFTATEISRFEKHDPASSEDQVFAMLKAWRQKAGSSATCGRLEDSLHQCNMNDAAVLLFP